MSSYTGPVDYDEAAPSLGPGRYICKVTKCEYNLKADAQIATLVDTDGNGTISYFMPGGEQRGEFIPSEKKEWLMFRFFGACDIPSAEYWEQRKQGENPANPGMAFADCIGKPLFVEVEPYRAKSGKVHFSVKALASVTRNKMPEDLGPSRAPEPAQSPASNPEVDFGF